MAGWLTECVCTFLPGEEEKRRRYIVCNFFLLLLWAPAAANAAYTVRGRAERSSEGNFSHPIPPCHGHSRKTASVSGRGGIRERFAPPHFLKRNRSGVTNRPARPLNWAEEEALNCRRAETKILDKESWNNPTFGSNFPLQKGRKRSRGELAASPYLDPRGKRFRRRKREPLFVRAS